MGLLVIRRLERAADDLGPGLLFVLGGIVAAVNAPEDLYCVGCTGRE